MKTKRIRGQKQVKIRYTNFGAHPPLEAYYPVENLRWLQPRCDIQIVR